MDHGGYDVLAIERKETMAYEHKRPASAIFNTKGVNNSEAYERKVPTSAINDGQ